MNPDDHRFLTDYLDGQLEADRQQLIESALVSDARLADELRDLTVVRDLVSSLSRDQRVNIAPRVMQRIQSRRPFDRIIMPSTWSLALGRPRRRLAAAMVLACLMLALIPIFWNRPRIESLPSAPTLASRPSVVRDGGTMNHLAATTGVPGPSKRVAAPLESSVLAAKSTNAKLVSVDAVPDTSAAPARTMEQLSTLLDNRNLRQIFVVSNQKDGQAGQRVASLVEQSTRFDFFTITIAQGVVIDPLHPEDATVFAMIVNPSELEHLRKQLRSSLKDDVEERSADPAIITQLADIGQVKSCKPSAPGQVTIPRLEMAFRADLAEADGGDRPAAAGQDATPVPSDASRGPASGVAAVSRGRVSRGRRRSAMSNDATTRESSLAEARFEQLLADKDSDADQSAVVLIWVRGSRSS